MRLEGFDELENHLYDLLRTMPIKRNKFIAQQGEILLGLCKDETPVNRGTGGGSLREGWRRTRANQGAVDVYNNTEYADHVEYGHRQKKRWVPGYWSGDSFIYDVNSNTGMMLKPKVIRGVKMMHKGLLAYKRVFAIQAGDMLRRIMEND